MESPEPRLDEDDVTLSALLMSLSDVGAARLSVDDIVAHFGRRSFGAVLFVFAIINLLPLPPGGTTILGLPLLLIAPQLMFGAKDLWLPRAVGGRSVDAARMAALCRRIAPTLRRVERLTTRRLPFMFGPVGDLAIGLVCTALAAVLILPIPLGNMLPATAVAMLSLSLVARDGALAILGHATAALSVGALVLSGHLVVAAAHRLAHMLGLS